MFGQARGPRVAIIAATIATLAGAAAPGCGGPLVSEETYDSPLLSFDVTFTEAYDPSFFTNLNIGIVWVDPLQLRDDLPQPSSGMVVTSQPGPRYKVDLFSPPPEAAIRRLPDPATGKLAVSFAFGELVGYRDGDADGRFAISSRDNGSLMFPPDAYLGSTTNRAVIYVETPAATGALTGSVWRALSEGAGYRLASVNCSGGLGSVSTLAPHDRLAVMTFARTTSPELIVTRTCLSPSRPATTVQP